MSKPRMIITDTDYGYIVSLQQRFIYELSGEIELEIITDPDYLRHFFSIPQKVDALIIAEELYDASLLRKHNINNIFILTERHEFSETGKLDCHPIYKYTSVKEIYSAIMGTMGLPSHTKQKAGGTKTILVTSATGGAGKTTIAFALSLGLSKVQKRVLYMDAENIQSFQFRMTNALPISGSDIYSELVRSDCHPYSALRHHIRTDTFSYIPPFKASLISLGLDKQIFLDVLEGAKASGDYDYIVVDSESCFDEVKIKLLSIADHVIFITKQDEMSVKATNNYVSNLSNISSDKFLFVCNDFYEHKKNELMNANEGLLFTVSEYINHFSEEIDRLAELGTRSGIQRITYLYI